MAWTLAPIKSTGHPGGSNHPSQSCPGGFWKCQDHQKWQLLQICKFGQFKEYMCRYDCVMLTTFSHYRVNSFESILESVGNCLQLILKLVSTQCINNFKVYFSGINFNTNMLYVIRSAGEISCHLSAEGWERLPHLLPDSVPKETRTAGWGMQHRIYKTLKKYHIHTDWNLFLWQKWC